MANYDEIKRKLKLAMKQMTGTFQGDTDIEPLPEVCIKGGNGSIFCLTYPQRKSFIAISRGTKALLINDHDEIEHLEHLIVYTFSGQLIEIDKEDLIFTGYD
tara:strand:+ start:3447 stop:3752 length:306 start_codon:yes stop_codon:yes gene_type:complete